MKRIWKRYLAALLVFTMVLNSTGATVLAETVRNGLVSHVQMKNTAQNLGLASGSNQINEEGELASTSDASSSDADIPCTKNDDCEALPGNHDIECPLYEGELLDDVSTPSNAILAMGFSEEDAALQYQQGKVGMTLDEVAFPETMVLNLKDLETGEEYEEETPVTWRLAQPADLAEFDTNLHTLLDEDGNPILDEKGMPVRDLLSYTWIFTPVLENSEDYDWSFLPDGYDSWNTYQEEQAGVYVQIGIMTLPENGDPGAIYLGKNEIAPNDVYWSYDESADIITLLKDEATYNIYPQSTTGDSAVNATIKAAEGLTSITVNLHGIALVTTGEPAFDFSSVSEKVTLNLEGENRLTSRTAILAPNEGVLDVASPDGNGLLKFGAVRNFEYAISGDGKDSSNINILNGSILIGNIGTTYGITNATVTVSAGAEFVMPYVDMDDQTAYVGDILDVQSFEDASTDTLLIKGSVDGEVVEKNFTLLGEGGFMMSLPKGTYKITTQASKDSGTATYSGKTIGGGDKETISFSVNGLSTYIDLKKINEPVFSENFVVDNSITLNSVKLQTSVNHPGSHNEYENGSHYVGTHEVRDKGFVIYGSDGNKIVGYYNANGLVGTTYAYTPDTAVPGNGEYAVEVKEGLTSGATYFFKPYVYTNELGLQIVEEYNESLTEKLPTKKKFKLPKVDYPDKITITYGALTGDFTGEELFDYNADTRKVTIPLDSQNGVAYTAEWEFLSETTVIPEGGKVGSTIDGYYDLAYKTQAGEFMSLCNLTVDAGTYNAGTEFTNEIGPTYIRFIPDDKQLYDIPAEPVTLVVNKANVKPVGLNSYTKEFDGNIKASNTTKVLVGPLVNNLDAQDTDESVYATFSRTEEQYDANYNSPEVVSANQITVKGLTLAGEKAKNYNLTGLTAEGSFVFQKTDEHPVEITAKPINLSLTTPVVRSGEKWGDITFNLAAGQTWVPGYELEMKDFFFYNVEKPTVEVTDWNKSFPTIDLNNSDREDNGYTVKFKLQDSAPKNYNVDFKESYIKFKQETPSDNSSAPAAFTLTGTKGDEGYYTTDLKISASTASTAYYDKVIPNGFADEITDDNKELMAKSAVETWTISQTTEEVKFRLYSSKTGAYTKVKSLGTIKIDKEAPSYDLNNIRYETKDNTDNDAVKKAINFLSFGVFFNETIKVSIDVTDNVSGISTNDIYYYIGETPTELNGQTAIFTAASESDNKSGTISFEIDANKDLVQFCAHDMAGNETGWVALRKEGEKWLIENTPPTVGEIKFDKTKSDTDWYREDVTASSLIQDVAGGSKALSGINQIEWVVETKTTEGGKTTTESDTQKVYTDGATEAISEETFQKPFSQDAVSITLKVRAQDNATNWSGTPDSDDDQEKYTVATFKLDKTAPTLTTPVVRYGEKDESSSKFYYKQAVISFDVSDATSGVTSVEISSDDGTNWTDASNGQLEGGKIYDATAIQHVVDKNGTYLIRVTDEAGNVKTSEAVKVTNVDKNSQRSRRSAYLSMEVITEKSGQMKHGRVRM